MLYILRKLKFLLHPIVVFVIAQVCWVLLMLVWVRWYLNRGEQLESLLRQLGVRAELEAGQSIILIEGCILMGILLFALYLVFVNFRRQVRLNHTQDAFISNVTHEFKTPLASIRLYAETLMMHELPKEKRDEFLEKTLIETERLQALVDRILVSARLKSNKGRSERETVDLTAIARQSLKKQSDRYSGKREFRLLGVPYADVWEEPFLIEGSPLELTILFDNLLDNALKYSAASTPITFLLRKSREKITFEVSDQGIGFESAQKRKIFGKFYRASDAAKINVKGSGLGLSVAKGVADAHGARLTASSPGKDKGATFHVEFPLSSSLR